MDNHDLILHPTKVSQISPVFDIRGCVSEWAVTVTFNNKNIVPPRASGARFSVKCMENSTQVEYKFPESVLRQGLERAWLFRDAMEKQIARLNNENTK